MCVCGRLSNEVKSPRNKYPYIKCVLNNWKICMFDFFFFGIS